MIILIIAVLTGETWIPESKDGMDDIIATYTSNMSDVNGTGMFTDVLTRKSFKPTFWTGAGMSDLSKEYKI